MFRFVPSPFRFPEFSAGDERSNADLDEALRIEAFAGAMSFSCWNSDRSRVESTAVA